MRTVFFAASLKTSKVYMKVINKGWLNKTSSVQVSSKFFFIAVGLVLLSFFLAFTLD